MKIIVGQHKLEIVKEPVNEREIDISKCEFEFDEAITSEYVKEAYFTLEGNTYKQIILNDECDIPSEVLAKKGTVEIGVVAFLVEDEEEIKRYNPSPAYFNTWVGSLKDNAENSEPVTPTDKEQMEQTLQEGLNSIDNKLGEVDDKMLVVDGKIEDIDTAITQTNNLNIDVNKVDKTTQVDLTKKDGTTKTVYINDGTSLQFMWQGTSLGIKTDDMEEYVFVNLQGIQGQPGPQGEPFKIKKTYTSVAEMNADFDNMNVGDYVMIASTVEVEDNAKLYVKGDSQWIFITDFSGAQGIKGETGATPIIRIGTVTSGSTPSVTISGTAEEPVFNFVLQPGDKGEKGDTGLKGDTGNGIASIIKTASAGLIDTYTITFTDGTTSTFEITNGADGGVTQEYVDEHDDQLRTLFNVLPKVSDSGESVTLENTGDTMLYKMDLKGNTSQEVVSGEVGLEVEDTSIYVDDVNEDKENYITLKGNTSQSILPSGYTQVDYIECTGTQYIDTGIKTNTTTSRYETKINPSSVSGTIGIFGTRDSSSATPSSMNVFIIDSTFRLDWLNGMTSGFVKNISSNTEYTISITRGLATINNVNYTSGNTTSINGSYTFYVGSFNNAGSVYSKGFSGKIYYSKLYNNNILVFDGVPCYRKSDNEIGMYDLVSNTFFTNAGAGNFTYGNVVPTPDAPQEIEVVTGLNEVKVEGKNLFDKDNATLHYRINTDGSITYREESFYSDFITVLPNTNYIVSGRSDGWEVNAYYDSAKNFISLAYGASITTPSNARYMRILGAIVNIDNIQLEVGSTATTYEAYQGASYSVNLGSIELCIIGDYQDRIYKDSGKWYIEKKIGKAVFNGSEDWNYKNGTFLPGSITNYKISAMNICLCSHFISQDNVLSTSELLDRHIAFRNDSSTKRLYIKDSDITSASDFTTWLASNNVTLYYILQTPTTTEITDTTLISQLNALYNATIYSTTHINTETSNLLPYIDLKYNVVTASPSPDRASEVEVVTGNNTITISNETGTKTQSYNITLGNLELCKIGDYQDYFYKDNGNWYLHKEVGKAVLNGSEVWQEQSSSTANHPRFKIYTVSYDYNMLLPSSNNDTFYGLCNNFKPLSTSNTYNSNQGISLDTTSNLAFYVNDITTLENFKTWLSTHNTIVYYVLATPTTTQITDQLLVSQLDELQKAMSYYDKTIITQTNDDKPFILDVIGIRDLQDIFNI